MVTAPFCRSVMKLKEELTKLGVAHDFLFGTNESLVHRGRNEMTATFMGTDFSHMMWIDADIEFEPESVAQLWNMHVDIAVGVYAMKKKGEDWFAAWKNGNLIKDLDQFKKPIEVDYAGTGFMLIDRRVLDALRETEPNYEGPNGRVTVYYQTPVHNDGFESEDYHFCRIAKEARFKVMMDPSIRLKHWGQFAYGA